MNKKLQVMREEVAGVREDLTGVRLSVKHELDEVKKSLTAVEKSVDTGLQNAANRMDTFLVRFDEVVEMLITSDTEMLQRMQKLEARMDRLEDRPPAA
ncbi:MAG: hypothetical protein ACYCW6_11085 [Candidatus Xenobia bacterium]